MINGGNVILLGTLAWFCYVSWTGIIPMGSAIKCKCNNKFKQLNDKSDQSQKEAILTAITNCGNNMVCEISMNSCDQTCKATVNAIKQASNGKEIKPSCMYEVGGQQGCVWFSGDKDLSCDNTRGADNDTQPNLRCRGTDKCNDMTAAQAKQKCKEYMKSKNKNA